MFEQKWSFKVFWLAYETIMYFNLKMTAPNIKNNILRFETLKTFSLYNKMDPLGSIDPNTVCERIKNSI